MHTHKGEESHVLLEGTIIYTEQIPEIGQEPNYEAALEALLNG